MMDTHIGLKQKVLLIDGHPVYIQKMEGFLEGLTFREILLACNGQEGISIAQIEQPDLILLSGMLPDMDSYEVLIALKEVSQKSKVIVQVGLFTDEESIERFKNLGASAVLPRKEKDLLPLEDAINQLIKG